jgi:hypothetical protein
MYDKGRIDNIIPVGIRRGENILLYWNYRAKMLINIDNRGGGWLTVIVLHHGYHNKDFDLARVHGCSASHKVKDPLKIEQPNEIYNCWSTHYVYNNELYLSKCVYTR